MIDPIALGLQVHGRSGNEASVICPYHDDNHASASFNMDKGLFFCYTCAAKGTAKSLAKWTGGSIRRTKAGQVNAFRDFTPEYRDFHSWAYRTTKMEESQKIVTTIMAERFGSRAGEAAKVGSKYDFFGLRTGSALSMFMPLQNKNGLIKGAIERRYLETDDGLKSLRPKYILHGIKPPIWPYSQLLDDLQNFDTIYITEGIPGALNVRMHDLPGFAILGANLYKESRSFFKRLAPYSVPIFDDDSTGFRATKQWLKLGAKGCIWGIEADSFSASRRVIENLVISPFQFLKNMEALA